MLGMVNMDSKKIINAIAEVGYNNISSPILKDIKIFAKYHTKEFNLNKIDGNFSIRELMCRFLLLNAVLDQGPDILGIRKLLSMVVNNLYDKEIQIIHNPNHFFQNIGEVLEEVEDVHKIVKKERANEWAEINNSNPSRYNLYMDNCTQTLNYIVFRWGVPLSLPIALERDSKKIDKSELLIDYLENEDDKKWKCSAEIMSKKIKGHKKYGLGKAIGDKAAHLYAKWFVHSFNLTRKKNISWGKYSFEVPFDSNAGRVLFRTGYLFHWAELKDYKKYDVIRVKAGKGNTDYIRVTNIRGKSATKNLDVINKSKYIDLCTKHLLTHTKAPITFHIQKIPIAQLLEDEKYGSGYLDDGLIHIGTKYCYNHDEPKCSSCPIRKICVGYNEDLSLISKYRT